MSSYSSASSSELSGNAGEIPEDLPPVKPPSAGFILQLFVVPGLIVGAVVLVWALFGKLAGGEQNWKSLLVELQHPNLHRRWRGANGLAQVLVNDHRLGNEGKHLSENKEIAVGLSEALKSELARGTQEKEDLMFQAFLVRTLGQLDVPAVTEPLLKEALQEKHDRDVRIDAVVAIGVFAQRQHERQQPWESPLLTEELLRVSGDEDPLVRQTSAFTLGLLPAAQVGSRLEVMLQDQDRLTRINAALALARQEDVRCLPVMLEVLRQAAQQTAATTHIPYEELVALKNCLTGVDKLAAKFTPEQRGELADLLSQIATKYPDPHGKLRLEAKSALQNLQQIPLPTAGK